MNNQNSSTSNNNNNNRPAARRTANAAETGGPRPTIIDARPGPGRGGSTTGGGDPDSTRVLVNATRDLTINGGGPSGTPAPTRLVVRKPGIGNALVHTISWDIAKALGDRPYAIIGSAALVLHGVPNLTVGGVSVLVPEGARPRRSEKLARASHFRLSKSGRVYYKKEGMKESVEIELWEPDEVRQSLSERGVVVQDGIAVLRPTRLLNIQCATWLSIQNKAGRKTEANQIIELLAVEYMHLLLTLIGDSKPVPIQNITDEFLAKLAVKEPELHAAFQKSRAWAKVVPGPTVTKGTNGR
ncbi:uncharacterized protein C8A04DRAFT_24672 [Dichotomopilus funicola]|uniref:Uncharacterized protein n=1 Tax=Dichotomopilus funicola TaxID=1934379 RepID=A0AAN6V9Q9_9PEZI|nr:hypothetical protein C8A04DRAFT_24672 [Dichotomopilus funicola]